MSTQRSRTPESRRANDTAPANVADGASLCGLALPRIEDEHDPTDPVLAAAAARLAARHSNAASSGATETATPILLGEQLIGFAGLHRASRAELRSRVRAAGLGPSTIVDTPEIWQAIGRPFMVVKHPLSGTGG